MKLASLLILLALAACSTAHDGPPNIGIGGVWNTDDHVATGGNGGIGASTGSAGRGTSGNGRSGAAGGMGHSGPGRG
ncbi:hypothetical protein [Burkholderia stagnalis]|uniref:hypothetical protein n=1 Tax=Burkholderia stagnalis TaxID=1503054 RepID=UPI000AD2F309|nr:hypothetical protein [Burkholderia stagnalis]